MKILFCLCAIIFCADVTFADEKAKPNVLFISIDDLNDYISPLDNHPAANVGVLTDSPFHRKRESTNGKDEGNNK
jgi:hypothetical protein